MSLAELIPFLRAQGVSKFSGHEISVEFFAQELVPAKVEEPKIPDDAPPEIKNPDLMNMDVIRDWSSPDQSPVAPPHGTNDVPMDGEP